MEKSNSEIAAFLKRTADLMEIGEANPFKIRSYRTASETISELAEPVAEVLREGGASELQKLPGIGKSISAQIVDFLDRGTSEAFEQVRREVPESATELLAVRGIGIKMATRLYREFGVLDLEALHRFAEGGGFEAVAGLGDKTIARFLPAVERAWEEHRRVPIADAREIAERLSSELRDDVEVESVDVVGEVRRGVEMVSAVELLAVVAVESERVTAAFATLPSAARPLVVAPDRAEIEVGDEVRAVLHVTSPERRWLDLALATGPRHHARELRDRVDELGLTADDVARDATSEEEVYARLDLPYAPPDER